MPDGWAVCTIGEIAFVTKLAGFEYTKDIYPNLSANGIPLFKGQNVQSGEIVYEFESHIPEGVSDLLPRSQINKKCILTPYVGTIGNVGIHTKEGRYHLGSNVGKIELYGGVLEEYIVTYIRSGIGYAELTKTKKATAQDSISIQAIRDVVVLLPPLAEQKRIVEAVNSFNTLIVEIENSKGDILFAVTAAKQKILSLAISGKLVPQDPKDEPASVLLERIRSEREQPIKECKIKRPKGKKAVRDSVDSSYYAGLPFEVPESWEWCRFGDICEIARGGSPRPIQDYITTADDGVNWIKIGDTTQGGKYITSVGEKIKPEGISRSRFVHAGDFLLTNSMSFGRPYILKVDGCIHDGWLVIGDVEQAFVADYLYHLLSSDWAYQSLSMVAYGSTVKNLKSDTVKAVILPIPPLTEQKRIVIAIEAAFEQFERIMKF